MDDNMLRMQQEAMARVREMQERSRRLLEGQGESPLEETPPSQEQEDRLQKKEASFLAGLGGDKDQFLLLLLAVLLVKSDAPIELVLALLYVAM